MLQITQKTSPQEISEYIKSLREQRGKEKETLEVINKALGYGHDFVINLFWEEALTYQHILMNDSSNHPALINMENVILQAKFWIEKYKVTKWYSRLYRFMGRVSDYKGEFTKSTNYYKRAIKFSKLDPEPFRVLELKAFLSYALIMSGRLDLGYKLGRKLSNDFESTHEGRELKKNDYYTWAVWRSGIVIRTINAFISKNITFDKKEMSEWLKQVESELAKGDFSYRKAEIEKLKEKLQIN